MSSTGSRKRTISIPHWFLRSVATANDPLGSPSVGRQRLPTFAQVRADEAVTKGRCKCPAHTVVTFVGKGFVESLETPIKLARTEGRDPQLGHYAAGWLVGNLAGKHAIWHPGGSFGFNTCILRFPDEKLAVIVLCNTNTGNARATAFRLAEMQLGRKLKPEAAATTTDGPKPGRFFFRHPRTKEVVVSIVGGSRTKLAVAAWDVRMRPVNGTSMVGIGTALQVSAKFLYRKDAPTDLLVTIGTQDPFLCKGFNQERVASGALEALAGTWRSDEVGATLELSATRSGMKIVDELQLNPGPLYALRRDLLVANDGFVINVERDSAHKVTALLVSLKGARGIRYTR